LKKGDISEEISRAKKAIGTMGGELVEVKKVGLRELTGDRCLVIIGKVGKAPDSYPRRPGMPAKRPLI
jgi:16S rRNA (guanine527-N7)-methyltransferase